MKKIGKIKTIGSLKRKPLVKAVRQAPSAASASIMDHEYSPETGHLIVTFRGGRRYRYEGVDQKTADGLAGSESKGRFLHANVIGKFDHTKL